MYFILGHGESMESLCPLATATRLEEVDSNKAVQKYIAHYSLILERDYRSGAKVVIRQYEENEPFELGVQLHKTILIYVMDETMPTDS